MVFRVRFMEIRWTRKPHYISDTWYLTSATPECNVRSETSVTVPSRLNAPIVLWRLNNLTLPARVGLKLSTWRLESVAGLQSTRLAKAVYCPLRWRFRTFEIGILAMRMMENVHYLSGHLFLAELSLCRKCHGIYRHRKRSRSREVCQRSLLFSLLSSGWKTVAQKEVLNSA